MRSRRLGARCSGREKGRIFELGDWDEKDWFRSCRAEENGIDERVVECRISRWRHCEALRRDGNMHQQNASWADFLFNLSQKSNHQAGIKRKTKPVSMFGMCKLL